MKICIFRPSGSDPRSRSCLNQRFYQWKLFAPLHPAFESHVRDIVEWMSSDAAVLSPTDEFIGERWNLRQQSTQGCGIAGFYCSFHVHGIASCLPSNREAIRHALAARTNLKQQRNDHA